METENLETESRKAKVGTVTGIRKTGILEWNNTNFDKQRNRQDENWENKTRVNKEIGKEKEESEKQSREYWNLIMDDNTRRQPE